MTLTWDPVTGAGSYMLGGPGTNVGMMVKSTSQTVSGIPQGSQTWTVATIYEPGGVLTTSDRWSRASTTVTNTSSRYRFLITGFRVNRATFDERINGNGDEVYAAAGVAVVDRRDSSVIHPWAVNKSDSYGDVGRNSGYVRAGSSTPTGGLWAGDVIPAGTDPRTAVTAPSSTRFPLKVWEGTLRDGIDVVIVKPTLWEIDGQVEYYNQWATLRDPIGNFQNPRFGAVKVVDDSAAQAAIVKERAAQGDITFFNGTAVFICDQSLGALPDVCGGGADRPIGIDASKECVRWKLNDEQYWCDIAAVFTREGIERALSASQVGGALPGSVTIPLNDRPGVDTISGGLDGSYDLYLRVERLP